MYGLVQRRSTRVWAGMFMAGALLAGGGAAVAAPASTPSQGSCEGVGAPPTEVRVEVGGVVRSALVHVPAGTSARHRAPLVLSFHGAGSTAEFQASYDGVDAQADRSGFISVHPQGTAIDLFGVPTLGWDIFNPNTTEPAFVRSLLDELESTLCIDHDRVYAIGLSNGGGMVELLACTLSDRIAAVSTVAPLPAPPCPGAPAVPTISFHGRQDLLVPYDGIPVVGLPGAEADMASIAARNGCRPGIPVARPVADQVARLRWRDCEAATVLYRLDGQGHSWPGHSYGLTEAQWEQLLSAIGPPPGLTVVQAATSLSLTNNAIDATAVSWSFFRDRHLSDHDGR